MKTLLKTSVSKPFVYFSHYLPHLVDLSTQPLQDVVNLFPIFAAKESVIYMAAFLKGGD